MLFFMKKNLTALGETHIVTVDGTAGNSRVCDECYGETWQLILQRIIAVDQCRCLNAVEKMYAGKKGFLVIRTTNGLRDWRLFRMCL